MHGFFPRFATNRLQVFLGTCLCMVVRRPDCYSYSFETLKLFAEVAVSSELSIYLAKKLVQFINLEALPWYSFRRSDSQCPPQDHEVHHGVMFLNLFTPEYGLMQEKIIKIQKATNLTYWFHKFVLATFFCWLIKGMWYVPTRCHQNDTVSLIGSQKHRCQPPWPMDTAIANNIIVLQMSSVRKGQSALVVSSDRKQTCSNFCEFNTCNCNSSTRDAVH